MDVEERTQKARNLLSEIAEPDEYSNEIVDAELCDVSSETTALQITRTLNAKDNQYGERPYPVSTYLRKEESDDTYPVDERFEHPPGSIYGDSIEYMEHGVDSTDCPHCEQGQNTCEDCDGEGEISCPECPDGKVTCDRCGGNTKISCENCDHGEISCENCDGQGRISCSYCEDGEQSCDFCGATGRVECPNSECGRGVEAGQVSCSICNASGKVKESCPNCSGSGVIKTDSETNNCTVCSGDGSVTQPCPDCHGGTNECNSCQGKGTISCSNCTGGTYRCSECGGSGTEACSECSGGTNPCGECGGSGTQPCLNCDNGQVTCPRCEGSTVVPCSTCDEDGTVPCSHCEGDNQLVYAEAGEVSYQTSTEKELRSDLGVDREMFNKGSVESTKTETTISPETADRGGEWIERQEIKSKQMTTLRVRYAVSPDGEREEYVAYRIDGAVHAPDRPENPAESVPDSDCPYCEVQLDHRDPEAYLRHWTDGSCTRTLQSLPPGRPSQVPTDVWWDIKYEWPDSGVWQPPDESDAHEGSNIIGSIVSSVRNLLK